MASFTSLPYELKLKIAESFIDLVIEQVSRIPMNQPYRLWFMSALAFEYFQRSSRDVYMPVVKLHVRPLLTLAPELQKDAAKYGGDCVQYFKKQWMQVQQDRIKALNEDPSRIPRGLGVEESRYGNGFAAKVVVAEYLADHLEDVADI